MWRHRHRSERRTSPSYIPPSPPTPPSSLTAGSQGRVLRCCPQLPFSSANPKLSSLIAHKRRLVVFQQSRPHFPFQPRPCPPLLRRQRAADGTHPRAQHQQRQAHPPHPRADGRQKVQHPPPQSVHHTTDPYPQHFAPANLHLPRSPLTPSPPISPLITDILVVGYPNVGSVAPVPSSLPFFSLYHRISCPAPLTYLMSVLCVSSVRVV